MRCRRIALLLLLLFISAAVLARVGGGDSYSGGSSSSSSSKSSSSDSSSSGGGGGSSSLADTPPKLAIGMAVFLLLCFIVGLTQADRDPTREDLLNIERPNADFNRLRRFDPNASRIVFEDFCYSLYARLHRARGAGQLDRYAPYASEPVRRGMMQRSLSGLTEVRDVIVGGMEITNLIVGRPYVTVDVTYDANLTEVVDGVERSSYVRERWSCERVRDILSPPPAKAKAEHCPRCGGALNTRTDGTCEHCGATVQAGTFNWYVRSVTLLTSSIRGPILTSNVEEQGTDLPTVVDPNLLPCKTQLEVAHPHFQWDDLFRHVGETAVELQDAWSARDWERVRPLETESLFQVHRYWIDAYIRQNLRNIVDDFTVKTVEPAKIACDAFYDAITFRVWASGRDHTIDHNDNIVAGSVRKTRLWTEYWTLIRTRGTDADPAARVSCPNCGAAVVVGATGICSFCSGKLTAGDFGWVLSRIEQDEAYSG